MADVPQTMAQWAAHGAINPLAKRVINTLVAARPLLAEVPIAPWPGGDDYSWILNKTAPTITWGAETATHEASQVLRKKLRTYLSYAHGDIQIPIHSSSTMDALMSMEMEDALDLIRAMGVSMAGKLWTGDYVTEASTTIVGTGLAATPYVDAVVTVSSNFNSGWVGLKYTHAGTFLQIKAPGSTTWGTQVACASDDDYTLTDGDDPLKKLTLTLDVSDLGANWESGGAIWIQKPENIAGLHGLAQMDTNQIKTASTNGDAATLAFLDELEEMCIGPKAEKYFMMNPRTRIFYKHLIAAAGGTRPEQYRDRDLSKYDLVYEGVPILADSNVAITETQGSASGVCGRIYCVRLNKDVGYHLYAGAHRGPNFGEMGSVSADVDVSRDLPMPVYMRKLGEADTKQYFKWRISTAIAAVLRNTQALAMRYGITS